jgi:hypothetical protein
MLQFLSRWVPSRARLVGIIHPALASETAGGLGLPVVLLHLVLLGVVLVVLFLANAWFQIPSWIPGRFRFLAHSWLPILFLLLYLLVWAVWWLWKLLTAEEVEMGFADVESAWAAALRALRAAGLSVTDRPLFLVLGQPRARQEALFQASRLPWLVQGVPQAPEAPVRVWANQEAVYVTCPGASLLGRHAALLALDTTVPLREGPAKAAPEHIDNPFTLQPPGPGGFPEEPLAQAPGAAGGGAGGPGRSSPRSSARDRPHSTPLKDFRQVESFAARLKALCRLIIRARRPYCPVNGILVLVPWAGGDSDQDATNTGDVCQRDLAVAADALQVRCPVFALLCDLEQVPGFREFVAGFRPEDRLQRIGQRSPLVPNFRYYGAAREGWSPTQIPRLDNEAVPALMMESLIEWICRSVVPGWIGRNYQLEKEAAPGATGGDGLRRTEVIRNNAYLFLFGEHLRERQKRLTEILVQATRTDAGEPILFGGCYLAGTGLDEKLDQAFVGGVFRRLLEEQDFVSWTSRTLAADTTYRRWALYSYLFLALLLLVGAGVVACLVFASNS